jgi:hypothetical protein
MTTAKPWEAGMERYICNWEEHAIRQHGKGLGKRKVWARFWRKPHFLLVSPPSDPALVYGTDFARTIKSENGGITWGQVNSRYKKDAGWISRGLDVTTGTVWCMILLTVTMSLLLKQISGYWKVKDGMVSWNSATKNNAFRAPGKILPIG